MVAHSDRKEEISQELKTLIALTEAMEKEDFEAGLATLDARKNHLMSLHNQFQMDMNAADLAAEPKVSPEKLFWSDSDDDDSDDDSDDDDSSDSDLFAAEGEVAPTNLTEADDKGEDDK